MLISVLFRSDTHTFPELLNKMTLGRKRKSVRNLYHGIIAESKKILGDLDFLLPDICTDRYTCLFFERTGKVTGRYAKTLRQILDRKPVLYMCINIVFTRIDMLGIRIASQMPTHFFCKIYHHLIMKFLHSQNGMYIVQLLYIKVTETKSLFQLHAILTAQPRHHSCSDHKMIFQICYRIAGQYPHTFALHKPSLLAVLFHRLHITAGYCPIKQYFLRRRPMLHLINQVTGFQKHPLILISHDKSPFCYQNSNIQK